MTALSDFLEERLINVSLATSGDLGYVVPFQITLAGSTDGNYNVTINGTQFQEASTGQTETQILDNLKTTIDAGSEPVSTARYTDASGNETLMVEQDGTAENIVVEVSSTGSTMNKNQYVWAALYTSDPTDSDGGTEVSAGGYARETMAFSAASSPGGTTDNTSDVTFGPATASWGTISHVAIRDSIDSSTGSDNMLLHGALTSSKSIASGDSFVFRAGDFDITFD